MKKKQKQYFIGLFKFKEQYSMSLLTISQEFVVVSLVLSQSASNVWFYIIVTGSTIYTIKLLVLDLSFVSDPFNFRLVSM